MHFQWLSAPFGWQNKLHSTVAISGTSNIEWTGISCTKAQIQRRHLGARLAPPTPRRERSLSTKFRQRRGGNIGLLSAENMSFDCQQHINCRTTIVWEFQSSVLIVSSPLLWYSSTISNFTIRTKIVRRRGTGIQDQVRANCCLWLLQIDCWDCFVLFRVDWRQVGLQ